MHTALHSAADTCLCVLSQALSCGEPVQMRACAVSRTECAVPAVWIGDCHHRSSGRCPDGPVAVRSVIVIQISNVVANVGITGAPYVCLCFACRCRLIHFLNAFFLILRPLYQHTVRPAAQLTGSHPLATCLLYMLTPSDSALSTCHPQGLFPRAPAIMP